MAYVNVISVTASLFIFPSPSPKPVHLGTRLILASHVAVAYTKSVQEDYAFRAEGGGWVKVAVVSGCNVRFHTPPYIVYFIINSGFGVKANI